MGDQRDGRDLTPAEFEKISAQFDAPTKADPADEASVGGTRANPRRRAGTWIDEAATARPGEDGGPSAALGQIASLSQALRQVPVPPGAKEAAIARAMAEFDSLSPSAADDQGSDTDSSLEPAPPRSDPTVASRIGSGRLGFEGDPPVPPAQVGPSRPGSGPAEGPSRGIRFGRTASGRGWMTGIGSVAAVALALVAAGSLLNSDGLGSDQGDTARRGDNPEIAVGALPRDAAERLEAGPGSEPPAAMAADAESFGGGLARALTWAGQLGQVAGVDPGSLVNRLLAADGGGPTPLDPATGGSTALPPPEAIDCLEAAPSVVASPGATVSHAGYGFLGDADVVVMLIQHGSAVSEAGRNPQPQGQPGPAPLGGAPAPGSGLAGPGSVGPGSAGPGSAGPGSTGLAILDRQSCEVLGLVQFPG
ncbi:MAG: hypothetical protein ACT4OS_10355 [Acidimicrobiales bacterium]